MIRNLQSKYYQKPLQHDDTITLNQMKANRPLFFKNKRPREYTQAYKGFLILRCTETFGDQSFRITRVYAYTLQPSLVCTNFKNPTEKTTIQQAKNFINLCLTQNTLEPQ